MWKKKKIGHLGKLRDVGKIGNLSNLGNLRRIVVILLFILTGAIISIFFLLKANLERNTVSRVVDGDSFEMKDGRRIRLLSIDAPEKGRCGWEGAYNRLNSLIFNKPVILTDTAKDDYGRILANVWTECSFTSRVLSRLTPIKYSPRPSVGYASLLGVPPTAPPASSASTVLTTLNNLFCPKGKLINKILAEEGLVKFIYVASPYYGQMKKAAQTAKDEGLGVWSDRCKSMIPKDNCDIKGNINSKGEKHYLVPSCPQYAQTIVDEGYGDVWFCTEDEAIKAGFVKAKCKL